MAKEMINLDNVTQEELRAARARHAARTFTKEEADDVLAKITNQVQVLMDLIAKELSHRLETQNALDRVRECYMWSQESIALSIRAPANCFPPKVGG